MEELPNTNNLSERELEVLHLVATGASNKEIALALSISQNTVKVHIRNIFSKTGVASRTEAAMYAVRLGLVKTPDTVEPAPAAGAGTSSSSSSQGRPGPQSVDADPIFWTNRRLRVGLLVVILLLVGWGGITLLNNPEPATALPSPAPVIPQARWEEDADLPVGRKGLALAVYENEIYAIGGQTDAGVVGFLTRYLPEGDSWETLNEKPTPVTNIGAAVVGGRLFVPGGRLGNQAVTDILEIYDPRLDVWQAGAPLPVPLSAYAIVAFEGRIYLFGGWDGDRFTDRVFVYDPSRDDWQDATPMPTPRGFSGAAVLGDRIYVIGGRDDSGPLAVNEEYAPDLEDTGETAWRAAAPMPEGRFGIGVAAIANVVHVFGGEGGTAGQTPWKYFPASDTWQPFEVVDETTWSYMGLVALETSIHVVGGQKDEIPTAEHRAYQAVFTIAIPVIPQP